MSSAIASLICQALDEKKQHLSSEQKLRIEKLLCERYKQFEQTLTELFVAGNTPTCIVIAMPLRVYISLQRRFDRGETKVYSGMANGMNRALKRAADGCIYAADPADGREVLPAEFLEQAFSVAVAAATVLVEAPLPSNKLKPGRSKLIGVDNDVLRNAMLFVVSHWSKLASMPEQQQDQRHNQQDQNNGKNKKKKEKKKSTICILELDVDLIKLGDDSHRDTFESMVADVKSAEENRLSFVWTRFSDGDHLCWPARDVRIRIGHDGEIDILANPNNLPSLIPPSVEQYLAME